MDNIMNFFDKITIDIFYIYYGAAYFYIAMLITYYFYKNGYKQFIYYPIIVFIYVLIMVYSPVVNIKYYNEGAMVISFRGKRALIQYNEEEDNDKLKKITLCEKMLNNDFKKYINDLKISHAKELLASGMYSVTEAALQSGYADLSHFSREFKKTVGISPKKFH